MLTDEDTAKLEQTFKKLPPIGLNEINTTGFSLIHSENKDLIITLFIRNGYPRDIQIEKLPLILKDASGEEIANSTFTLDSFKVKSNTSKPLTVVFPKELLKKENPDFSRWMVYPKIKK